MTVYRIVPAEIGHVREILPNLRKADIVEGEIATGLSAEEALTDSVMLSYEAIAAYADDCLVMLAGVAPVSLTSSVARPWMVGTDELSKHAFRLCKENRCYVKKWLAWFSYLENWVDAENKPALKWLKWLGFELEDPIPWGNSGHFFIRFHQEAKLCVS